ncbi:Protein ENHANCED DISEASE RESISTANCE 2-like [Diplonema papillatum]|nr:Protein ENHANCED DISEASE RESISTANCE 2-like [Diplonema papillatum]
MPPSLEASLKTCHNFTELRELAHPRTRSKLSKPKVFEGGVRTYTKVTEGSALHVLLGEFEVPVKVEDFKSALSYTERVNWDDLFTGGSTMEAFKLPDHPELDVFHRHMRFRSPAPILVSPRDFELLISEKFEPDGSFICKAVSVASGPKSPKPEPGTVRGEILTTGFVAKPYTRRDGGPGTKVVYVAQVDPKGWVPAQVVNLIVGRQATSIQNLKRHILRTLAAKGKPAPIDILSKL